MNRKTPSGGSPARRLRTSLAAALRRGFVLWLRGLRISVYLGVVFALLGVLWLREVRAQLAEGTGALFRSAFFQGMHGEGVLGEPQPIDFNGQRAFIASHVSEQSISEVFDRYERRCLRNTRELGGQPDPETRLERLLDVGSVLPRLLTHRAENERAGQLACISPNRSLTGAADLMKSLTGAIDSGDLERLGELRYVRAESLPDDAGTHVLTVWTEGPFNLRQALPTTRRDAGGRDPDFAPRPPRSTRTLSAQIPSRSYEVYGYSSELSKAELLRHYATEMPRRGWQPLSLAGFGEELEALSKEVGLYSFGQATTYVVVEEAAAASTVILMQGGPRGMAVGRSSTFPRAGSID